MAMSIREETYHHPTPTMLPNYPVRSNSRPSLVFEQNSLHRYQAEFTPGTATSPPTVSRSGFLEYGKKLLRRAKARAMPTASALVAKLKAVKERLRACGRF